MVLSWGVLVLSLSSYITTVRMSYMNLGILLISLNLHFLIYEMEIPHILVSTDCFIMYAKDSTVHSNSRY